VDKRGCGNVDNHDGGAPSTSATEPLATQPEPPRRQNIAASPRRPPVQERPAYLMQADQPRVDARRRCSSIAAVTADATDHSRHPCTLGACRAWKLRPAVHATAVSALGLGQDRLMMNQGILRQWRISAKTGVMPPGNHRLIVIA
jgi:hypothetical protein